MKKEFGEYYLGLDIGTDSLGWAVTDLDYGQMKLNRKALWGVRLFDAGNTAAERRLYRCARRRNERCKQRIRLLQELFADEIMKSDPNFFMRLADSRFVIEDKHEFQPNALFNDAAYSDKDYYKSFPTIYHLRKDLMENGNKHDIRLVYLAIHHILKHRGHFLFEGQNIESIQDFKIAFQQFSAVMREELEMDFSSVSPEEAEKILKDKDLNLTKKKKELGAVFSPQSKAEKTVISLLCGGKEKLSALFDDASYDDAEIKDITFKGGKFEECESALEAELNEKMVVLYSIKALYDWSVLAEISRGYPSISYAKAALYEKHHQDLWKLKRFVKMNCPKEYKKVFSDPSVKNNYCAYIGSTGMGSTRKNVSVSIKKCSAEDFCKFLKGLLKGLEEKPGAEEILREIENGTFLPKQTVIENSVIPYQMHLIELDRILENASKYYEFLNKKDDSGLTVAQKVRSILTFRIPYYVGPLNDSHKTDDLVRSHCWIQRKESGRILPWNFEEKVDVEASAEMFIKRMTNYCTYLPDEKVLPKNSLIYSEFTVLNELNNLKINGEKITVDLKQRIYHDLFCKKKKVTAKQLKKYLLQTGEISDEDDISGVDGDFKSSLTSYIEFKGILNEKIARTEMIEDLIRWIVLFGEDKKLLRSRINAFYGSELTKEEQKQICALKYTGWGRLSEAFLTEVEGASKETGENFTILGALRNTNDNLMQLLGSGYTFADEVTSRRNNADGFNGKPDYAMVDAMYVSPSVKRGIWQTLTVVKELEKILGHAPKKIFLEVTRGEGEKKRTVSRKDFLISCYKNCKKEERDWVAEISEKDEQDFRKNALFLYYTQMGRCMYSGEPIRLDDLLHDTNIYDIDHIYPRSKIKDDSILKNKVLVKKVVNNAKSNVYPLPREIQEKQKPFWAMLKAKGFISKEKYERLVRTTPFSAEEQADFIARQIVETSQSVKAVADLLKKIYPDSPVVYSKAGNVSDFRQRYDLPKVRCVNDFHHAKDAYLNIVVGNVYDTKFTRDPRRFFASKESYNLNRMYDFDVERGGVTAWKAGENGTIAQVKKVMAKNNVLFTRYAVTEHGSIADQMPMKKGKGQLPLKSSDPRLLDISKYGGYNKVKSSYYFLVEHIEGKAKVRSMEFVPVHLVTTMEGNESALLEYCTDALELKSPRILIEKIKINSLFNVDGFLMHLSGRTGEQLIFKGANQLCVGSKEEVYLKKIEQYVRRAKEAKKTLPVTVWDGLSEEENLALYDVFLDKLKNTVYHVRLSAQVATLERKRDTFMKCSVEDQVLVLAELVKLFQCNSVSANLKGIGGPGSAGILVLSKTVSKCDRISLIHQSPTGVFSQEVDLLKL